MKPLSLIACSLHFLAVLLTSCVGLCVGNDGHATYEWTDDECCGEAAAVVIAAPSCCDACEPVPTESIAAAPDCGGCLDTMAPVTSGMHVVLHQAIPAPVVIGDVFLAEMSCASETFAPPGAAPGGPPIRMPLRC